MSADEGRVLVERRSARTLDGRAADGLFDLWITLDNAPRLNAYTPSMLEALLAALRAASAAPDLVAVVLTGAGDRSFCTGGDARHYGEEFAGRPEAFRAYLHLFADVITAILQMDKPVVNRVNGMRLAGGQELGMACDVSVSSDLAVFGQTGARHGSAPDMGSTDFLPLFVGIERATVSCTLGQTWTAHEALRLGLVTEVVPVLVVDGKRVPNPLVVTDRWLDDSGAVVHGRPKEGSGAEEGRRLLARGRVDLAPLDEATGRLCARFLETTPGCLVKTLSSMRKHKADRWERNRETNRHWLALNMLSEGAAGFRAFAAGSKDRRTVDFVALRQALARGTPWSEDLIRSVLPPDVRPERRP